MNGRASILLTGLVVAVLVQAHGAVAAPGDDCTQPLPVSFGHGDAPLNLSGQTTCGRFNDYDGTCLAPYDGGQDIIYELTMTSDACVQITVDADTLWAGFAVFSACPDTDPNACLATAAASAHADVITGLFLTAGTYWIMVDTWPAPACTSFDLTIEECPLAEDCHAAADILTPLPYTETFINDLASADEPEGSCDAFASGLMQNDLWWDYFADQDCTVQIDVTPTSYDAIVTVRVDCWDLVEIACSDDGGIGEVERLTFDALAGVHYFVQVGSAGNVATGGLTMLDVQCQPPAGTCSGDTNGDDEVNTDDFLAVLANWGDCAAPCPPQCTGELTDDCTVNTDDFLAVLSNWGPCVGP